MSSRPTTRALPWVLVAAIAAVVLVGAVVRSNRFSVAEVDVAPGTAWLALVSSGETMLVNGGSGEVALRVAVAAPGSPLEVVQHGDGAVVLDRRAATLQRVSARSLEPTASASVDGEPTALVAGRRSVHVTGDDAIRSFDPTSLEQTGEVALGGELDALVDGDERLWVLDHGGRDGGAAGSDTALHRVAGDEIAETIQLADVSGDSSLTLVDGRPVVIDAARASITVIEDGEAQPPVELSQLTAGRPLLTAVPRPGRDLPAILMVLPDEGRYLSCDVDDPRRCEELTFGGAGDSFGPPQYVDGRLFVPDRTKGQVVVIDTGRNEHITTTTVLREPTQELELVATDDLVWFNNLAGSEAGVLDQNGDVRRVVRKLADDASLTEDALGEGEGAIERRDGGEPSEPGEGAAEAGRPDDSDGDTSGQDDGTDGGDGTDADGDDGGDPDGDGAGDDGGGGGEDTDVGATDDAEPADATDPSGDPAEGDASDPGADATVEVPPTTPDGPGSPNREVEAGEDPGGVEPLPGGSEPTGEQGGEPGAPRGPDTSAPETTVPTDELVAQFAVSADLVEIGTEVRFEDRSTGEPTSWEWDFDDEETGSGQKVSHVWDEAGTYRVVLTVTDDDGGTRTRARDITVENTAPLRAGFRSVARAEVREEVQLFDDSVGEPDEWLWSFDDGTTSTDRDPVHRWHEADTYVVTLEIRRGDRTDRVQYSIEIVDVIEPPEARFESPARATEGAAVQFADRSTGGPTSWSWDFGDGTGSTQVNPVHRFASHGDYTVSLTVANSAGESEEFRRDIRIEEEIVVQGDYRITSPLPPRLEVGESARLVVDVLAGPPVTITATSPQDVAQVCRLSGVTRSGSTVAATLVALDRGDCRVEISQPATDPDVIPAVARSIRVEIGERAVEIDGTLRLNGQTGTLRTAVGVDAPLQIAFDLVTDPLVVTEYRWSFDNGRETVRGSAAGGGSLTATAPGEFFVSGNQRFELVVLAVSGEPTRVTMPISVSPPALEIIPPTSVVAGVPATFAGTSGTVPVTSWTWDFGDESGPVAQADNGVRPARTEVQHTFAAAGQRTVRLVLDTGFETISQNLVVTVDEPGGADLVIVSVSDVVTSPCPPDRLAATVAVRNIGTVASEARPNGGPVALLEVGGGDGGSASLPAIAPGETIEVRIPIGCVSEAVCLTYAGATVSYQAAITNAGPPETNTANNTHPPISVTYPADLCEALGTPHLVLAGAVPAVGLCPGDRLVVTATVRNDGTAPSPAYGAGAVSLFDAGVPIGSSAALPALAPGASHTVQLVEPCGTEAECLPFAGATVSREVRIAALGPAGSAPADSSTSFLVDLPANLCDGYP